MFDVVIVIICYSLCNACHILSCLYFFAGDIPVQFSPVGETKGKGLQ
jgi:hypothetical protein